MADIDEGTLDKIPPSQQKISEIHLKERRWGPVFLLTSPMDHQQRRVELLHSTSHPNGKSILKLQNKLQIFFLAWTLSLHGTAINEFADKYTYVKFIKIDVDELHDVPQEYGMQAMPYFILIKKGKEVDKLVGANKDFRRRLRNTY